MTEDLRQAFTEMHKTLEAFEESASKLANIMYNAVAKLEGAVGAELSRLKSQDGQSPEQDRLIEAAIKELMDSGVSGVTLEKRSEKESELKTALDKKLTLVQFEKLQKEVKKPYSAMDKIVGDAVVESQGVVIDEPALTSDERLALAKTTVEEIVLRDTLTKYKTFYDEERTEPRGWLIKLLDENDRETDDGNEWLCRTFVKWVQELPREISARDEHNKRDRSYPTRTKRSIYVNDGEMAYIEELAREQEILVQEKEFVS